MVKIESSRRDVSFLESLLRFFQPAPPVRIDGVTLEAFTLKAVAPVQRVTRTVQPSAEARAKVEA